MTGWDALFLGAVALGWVLLILIVAGISWLATGPHKRRPRP